MCQEQKWNKNGKNKQTQQKNRLESRSREKYQISKTNQRRIDLQFSRSSNRSRYNRKIKIARGKDKEVVKILKKIRKVEVKVLRGGKWQVEEDLILKKRKIYILKDEKLKDKDNLVTS